MLSENRPPLNHRVPSGGVGNVLARKPGLGGGQAAKLAPTPSFGLHGGLGGATPAASKSGGARAPLGDISNRRAAPPAQQHEAGKRANLDEVAAVVAAAADFEFAKACDLPPVERMYTSELTGPVPLDRSGFDVEAAVAVLCEQRALALGGTPFETRSIALEQPPVFAEVPPSPAVSRVLQLRTATTSRQYLLPVADAVDDAAPLSPSTLRADGPHCAEHVPDEMHVDLSRLELVPPTPCASGAFDADSVDEENGDKMELEGTPPLAILEGLARSL